jgi:UPF0716 protein FxsA
MNLFTLLLLAFIAVPVFEIYLFVKIGGLIGAGATIGLVLLTALLGAWLLRLQGLATIARVRGQLDAGRLPAMELLEGVVLVFCGALLLTPGFFTDLIGFLGLVPPVRQGLIRLALRKGLLRTVEVSRAQPDGQSTQGGAGRGRTLEGEWRREE